MEYLNNLFSLNPNIKSIDLSNKYFFILIQQFRKIKDVKPLLLGLSRFKSLTELDLSENLLTFLPFSLKEISTVQSLNISGNLFQDLSATVKSLQTLPNLVKLSINLEDKDSVKLVLDSLPRLQILNEQEIEPEPAQERDVPPEVLEKDSPKPNVEPELKGEPLHIVKPGNYQENVENELRVTSRFPDIPPELNEENSEFKQELITFHMIRNLRSLYEPDSKPKLTSQISQKLSALKFDLVKPLSDHTLPEAGKTAVKLKARYELLDMCICNMLEIQPDPEYKKIWEEIKKGHDEIVENLLKIVLSMKPDLERSVSWYKTELDKMKKEMKDTLEIVNKLNDEIQLHNHEKEEMRLKFEYEKSQLLSMRSPISNGSQRKQITTTQPQLSQNSQNFHSENLVTPSVKFSPEGLRDTSVNMRNSPKTQGKYDSASKSHTLSLKQLKEVIQDIYVKKRLYDSKCLESKLPKENMEQYLYTYLNQQYGLKNLILDWTKSILEGLAKYSMIDSEVALFGKILRNECEEGFQYTFAQTKNDIIEILKGIMRTRRKYITEQELNGVIEEIMRGTVNEEIYNEIVKNLCNPQDYPIVIQKIREKIIKSTKIDQKLDKMSTRQRKEMREIEPTPKKIEQKIMFADLQNLLLEYILVRHELNIKKFAEMFRKIDEYGSGILNESEFKKLVSMLRIEISPIVINKMLATLDPYQNQKITFSDCLTVFQMVFF